MTGGLLQISKRGAQDVFLIGNPQMTYFKSIYKRHTNFAFDYVHIEPTGQSSLSFDLNTVIQFKIPRVADLLHKIYLVVNVPDIYSGYYDFAPSNEDATDIVEYKFQWIRALGSQIIHNCQLLIGGQIISTLYGQWIEIWHELFADKSKQELFESMIGNTLEMNNPQYGEGASFGVYPTSTLTSDHNKTLPSHNSFSSYSRQKPFYQPPSINKKTLHIPLPFWFCNDIGLSLPLISLQYHEIQLQCTLRPINELYTIIDPFTKKRIKPTSTDVNHHINNFTTETPPNTFSFDSPSLKVNQKTPPFNVSLLAKYIYLDDEERNLFAQKSHEYLIEQVSRQDFFEGYQSETVSLDLKINNPVKYLVWFGQRDDVALKNEHNNYTNRISEYVHPSSNVYIENQGLTLYETPGRDIMFFQINSDGDDVTDTTIRSQNFLTPTKVNFTNFHPDIIRSSRLLLDKKERFDFLKSAITNEIQAYETNTHIEKKGIHLFSFSAFLNQYQPSGACNMSLFNSVVLELQTNIKLSREEIVTNSYNNFTIKKYPVGYNFFVYVSKYNLFRVSAGTGGIAFAN